MASDAPTSRASSVRATSGARDARIPTSAARPRSAAMLRPVRGESMRPARSPFIRMAALPASGTTSPPTRGAHRGGAGPHREGLLRIPRGAGPDPPPAGPGPGLLVEQLLAAVLLDEELGVDMVLRVARVMKDGPGPPDLAAIACPGEPDAEIHVLPVEEETLVETPDLSEHGGGDEQRRSGQPADPETRGVRPSRPTRSSQGCTRKRDASLQRRTSPAIVGSLAS